MSANTVRVVVEAIQVAGKWQPRAIVVTDRDNHKRFDKSYSQSLGRKLYDTKEAAERAGEQEIERWQYNQP